MLLRSLVRLPQLLHVGICFFSWTFEQMNRGLYGMIYDMSCAQSVHALRTLRSGVKNVTLQIVIKSVAVAKLVYAASAWYGFCTAADRDRLEGSHPPRKAFWLLLYGSAVGQRNARRRRQLYV